MNTDNDINDIKNDEYVVNYISLNMNKDKELEVYRYDRKAPVDQTDINFIIDIGPATTVSSKDADINIDKEVIDKVNAQEGYRFTESSIQRHRDNNFEKPQDNKEIEDME